MSTIAEIKIINLNEYQLIVNDSLDELLKKLLFMCDLPYGISFNRIRDDLATVLQSKQGLHLVLATNQEMKIYGAALFQVVFDECELHFLGVDVLYQKSGIGIKVLQNIIDFCRTCLVKKLYLEVSVKNNAAICLYKKSGFSVLMERKKYYKNGESAFVMEVNI